MPKRCCWSMLLAATLPFPTCAAEIYTIDPEHSDLRFSISHFLFLTTHGRFGKISGKVTLERVAKNGAVDIDIEASSVNTDHAKRDENLRSPNFLNATKYPKISYQSSAVKFINDTPASVEGQLTLLDVTKPVTLTINNFKCDTRPTDMKELCSATANAQIKRSDFGMTYALPLVGDEIKLEFEIEAYKD